MMRHPDPVRVVIAAVFVMIATLIMVDVPPLLAATGPTTALLLGVHALLGIREGGR